MKYDKFPPLVAEHLGYYVYFLRDPRNDEVFYVGKGVGDRIFYHMREALDEAERHTAKLDRIRAISAAGYTVTGIILRHGLTEKEAFEVEASIIDFIGLSGLTNAVEGHHTRMRGMQTIEDIIILYGAEPVEIQEPAVILNVNQLYYRGMDAHEIYEVTRGDWVMGKAGREKVKYAFAVFNGVIREIYTVDSWEPVTIGRDGKPYKRTRWRFMGQVATLMHQV